jgi:FMN hydrolase / 5-amino-6-(5-phospho-D-ribitylamino)uracil phosphatase
MYSVDIHPILPKEKPMKFYRRLRPFKAISFDLDDTLYANQPIMKAAEAKMEAYFNQQFSAVLTGKNQSLALNQKFWQPFREKAIKILPELAYDVVRLRVESYYHGACALGYSPEQARQEAERAMYTFTVARSNFIVPEKAHRLLSRLKTQYPIVSISNGNVDTRIVGIDGYFKHSYHATGGVKQKPDAQLFNMACKDLNILPHELLHIGDCGLADIEGAIAAGCQTVWVSCYNVGKPIKVIPHVMLEDISDLTKLIITR